MSAKRQAGSPQGVVLVVTATLSVMGVLLIAPILPQLIAYYADTPGIAFLGPVILTVPAICIALFSPLAGWAADRVGRRRILLIAMFLYGPLGAAPMVLDSIWAVLASRVALGLTEAIIMTASTTLIGDYFEGRRRDTWLAWQVGAASISAIFLMFIGGLLGEISWRAPFAIYFFAWFLGLALLMLTWEPAPSDRERDRASDAGGAFPVRLMILICGVTLFGGVVFYIVPIQLSVVLATLGITNPAMIGGSAAFGSLVVPLGALIFRRLTGRLSMSLILGGAFLIAGLGMLVMGLSRTYLLTMVGVLINQLGCGVILPTLLAWAMASLPLDARGRGVGFWTGAFFIGQFFSPVLLTLGVQALGSVGKAVIACGIVALGCAAVGLIHGAKDGSSSGRPAQPNKDTA
ncbi:MFS transporter [Brevundimonas sp. SL130]|nr:MFS transporter [Brevundimonas sp. SL130]